jgi:thermitase
VWVEPYKDRNKVPFSELNLLIEETVAQMVSWLKLRTAMVRKTDELGSSHLLSNKRGGATALTAILIFRSQSLLLIKVTCSLLLAFCFVVRGEEQSLNWHLDNKTVDAQLSGLPLDEMLSRVAHLTGWEIFVEPDLDQRVSVSFKKAKEGEALRLLLGKLNFALLPRSNAASRLYIYRTSLQEATKMVMPAPEPKKAVSARLRNELVVTLKKDAKETIEELAKRLGAKIIGRADDIRTYRLQFESESGAKAAEEALKDDKEVRSTEGNYAIQRPKDGDNLSYTSPSNFNLKPSINPDSSKIIVAVIDTPVQQLPEGMDEFLLPSLRTQPEVPQDASNLNHGTSMAETILHGLSLSLPDGGETPVRILPVDVYGASPNTTTFDVVSGVYKALNAGANVINMSLGGGDESPFLHSLIEDAHRQGVIFVGAAGNQPTTNPTFPAAYPEVIAVTAGDRKGNIAPYANRGDFVDVIAPGTSIVDFNGETYLVTGTSASTAYISGAVAAARASGKSAQEAEALIRKGLPAKLK